MKNIKYLSLLIITFFLCSTLSFAGPTKHGTYVTVTVVQGKGQSEIIVHYGGEKMDDNIVSTPGDDSKDIDEKREQEYNSVIDTLNKLSAEGYEVVNMSVSMAGADQVHPYTVYLLKKKH